jgi:integrase
MARRNQGAKLRYLEDRKAFYICWTEHGRSRKCATGTADSAEAESVFAEWLQLRGKPTTGPRDPSQTLVSKILEDYLVEAEQAKQSRIAYAVIPLTEFFAENSVAAITPQTCRNYGRQRKLSAGTVRRELGVLRAAVNHAYKEGRITRAVPVAVPDGAPPRDRWLTREEAAAVIKAAKTPWSRSYLPLFILIGIYTGRRKEAILSLRWPQVDLKAKLINFNRPGAQATNKRRGIVRIPARLLPHLVRARARGSDLGYVVNDHGLRIKRIDKGFRLACQRAGLSNVIPHTLRHTAATWLMKAKVPIWEAAEFLSMSEATLVRVYAHHNPDFTTAAAEAIGSRPMVRNGA